MLDANRRTPVHGRPRGICSVPSCPASSGDSGPRSTLLAPRPVHPPPRVATAMHEARASLELGIQALFFGDFLLGLQKKVTRPPGRIPGALPARPTHPDGEATNRGETRSRRTRPSRPTGDSEPDAGTNERRLPAKFIPLELCVAMATTLAREKASRSISCAGCKDSMARPSLGPSVRRTWQRCARRQPPSQNPAPTAQLNSSSR